MIALLWLWQKQGIRRAAYSFFGPRYNWVTESFDTADVKAARALVAELSEGR